MSRDFVTPVEWWPKERFRGRENTVEIDGKVTDRIPVPDDDIVCDLCNDPVDEFPCAVVHAYALCSSCRKTKYFIKDGDDEYFETWEYHMKGGEPKAGVTHGGRRKK